MPMAYDDRDDDLEDDDDDLDIRVPGGTVPNYLTQAILVTLCCCVPFGIVAIVNASKVNTHLARGEYEQAIQASQEAKKWCWIGFVIGLIAGPVIFYLRVGRMG
jgi:Interferon-induced transmembrane protein